MGPTKETTLGADSRSASTWGVLTHARTHVGPCVQSHRKVQYGILERRKVYYWRYHCQLRLLINKPKEKFYGRPTKGT